KLGSFFMLIKNLKRRRRNIMLTRDEVFLFNRELIFLLNQHSSCTDSSLKKMLVTQIALILAALS
ncbi:hypothetical protein V8V54_07815, partial [Priestia megaterium]|uniref:hypothetical protein n=1 Tax=Priestia megaterium TaxID=1404 RepID=UPI001C3F18B4